MDQPLSGGRFVVIATGRAGMLLEPAKDGHWKVILDELDDVTEFAVRDLRLY